MTIDEQFAEEEPEHLPRARAAQRSSPDRSIRSPPLS
jgi:hypothetical protein